MNAKLQFVKLGSSRGQALVEHLYLWPLLLLLVLGILQFSLFYRNKALINHATFQAAREGALNHAFRAPMMLSFLEALAPVYMSGRDPNYVNYQLAVNDSFARNFVDRRTGRTTADSEISGVKIEILTPNRPVFDTFAIDMNSLVDDCESLPYESRPRRIFKSRCTEQSYFQIPNDNLNIRDATTRTVDLGESGTVEMNLQDANLLKIRGHWCAPLDVPLVSGLIYKATSSLVGNDWDQNWVEFYQQSPEFLEHPMASSCIARNMINRITTEAGFTWQTYYIPITSDAIVRMQSPIRCESVEPDAVDNCMNF